MLKKMSGALGALAALAAACSGDVTALAPAAQSEDMPADGEASLLAFGDSGPGVVKAHAYFMRYGYFENEALRAQYPRWRPVAGRAPADDSLFGAELERAVSAFQARSGQPVTGVIDAATQKLMAARFCGVPDSFESEGADKWDDWDESGWQSDHSLTYSITIDASDNTGGLTPTQVASVFAGAFNTWRAKTNLTFTKISSNADIDVIFVDRSDSILGIGTSTTIFMTNSSNWGQSGFNMTTVALHEIGHSLGYWHSSRTNGGSVPLMYPTVDTGGLGLTGLTQDELHGIAASPYTTWKAAAGLAGEASDIGSSTFGGAETTWKVGNGTNSEGFKVWRWKREDEDAAGNGGSWLQINGAGGSRIDVSGRVPWVVVSAGANAGSIKSMLGADQTPNGTGWARRGNCGFVDVGANATGSVWALGGSANSSGDYDVYRFIGGSNVGTDCSSTLWREVTGDARYIDVAPDGSPWVVTSNGSIYHRNGVTDTNDGSTWSKYGGLAKDIAIGPDAWGPYGAIWITGHPSQTEDIFLLNIQPPLDGVYEQNHWYRTPDGEASFITVGRDALPWVAASNGSVWRRRP